MPMGGGQDDNLTAKSAKDGSNWTQFVAPSPDELNELLPQFEVIELVGQGGMGAVYKARQMKLDRIVALKLLPPFDDDDQHHFAERFEREAQAMARLNHPNIVTVHDYGETDRDHRYFVMEYVDGSDLHTLIQGGQLTVKHALGWMPYICAAIRYAHEKEVIHRDIKPANVLISSEGEVKVGDFGLAKLVGSQKLERSITRTQVSMGTPDYAAPEALEEGANVDHRADIYSLGVLFYEMLTGKVPRGAWSPPSALKDLDVRLDQIIIKAMQPDPAHRYQSVAQIEEALSQLRNVPRMVVPRTIKKDKSIPLPTEQDDKPKVKVTQSSQSSAGKTKKKSGGAAAGAAIVGVMALVGIVLFVLSQAKKSPTDITPAGSLTEETTVVPAVPFTPPEDTTTEPQPPEMQPATPDKAPRPQGPDAAPDPGEGWVDLLALDSSGIWSRGQWEKQGALGMRISDGAFPAGLRFPQETAPNYEAEFVLQKARKPGPLAILLPIGDRTVALAMGSRTRGSGPNARDTGFMTLAQVDGHGALDSKNPTLTQVPFETTETHRVRVRVVTKGDRASVLAFLDDNEALRWSGRQDQLSLDREWTLKMGQGKSTNTLSLITMSPMGLREGRLKTLGNNVDLDKPLKAEVVDKPNDPKKPNKPPKDTEPDTDPTSMADMSVAELRLKELEAQYDAEILASAETPFVETLDTLNTYYQNYLGELVTKGTEAGDDLLKTQAEEELARLESGIPMEPVDPVGMHQEVTSLRDVYRQRLETMEEDRDEALLPILRAKLADLATLRQEMVALEDTAGEALVTPVMDELAAKIEPLAVAVELEGHPLLQRSDFPRTRPLTKGKVIAWSRDVDSPTSPLLSLPPGVSSSVAAIDGNSKFAVALKSSGTVVGWGADFDASLTTELDALTRVTKISVANDARTIHFAALDQDGKIKLVTRGWGDFAESAVLVSSAVPEPVDFNIFATGGLAIQVNGGAAAWGDVTLPEVETMEDIVKLVGDNELLIGISEDGSVEAWGPEAGTVPEDLERAYSIILGTQTERGGVALMPGNKIYCWGFFDQWQEDLSLLTQEKTVEKLVGGHRAFAVRLTDESWHFFGQGIDADTAAVKAQGCEDIVIARDVIIGLQD